MTGDTVSRADIRAELASEFADALVGQDLPYQAIFTHDVRGFKGQMPSLLILSEGSQRPRFGIGTDKYKPTFRFTLLTFVADADPEQNWTEENVEDALDACEKALADCVIDHKSNSGYWQDAYLDGTAFSEIQNVTMLDGNRYKMERTRLIVETHDA